MHSRSIATIILVTSVPSFEGCTTSRRSPPRREQALTGSTDFNRGAVIEKISFEELDELTNAFADRYRTLMEDAVAEIIKGNPDAHARAIAQRFLVESTTSAYDIATNGDPFSQVLDMTIMVTVTSQVWIDDDRATREFGQDRGEPLVSALRQAREEVWRIASRVFLADQLAALDFMIAGWRRENRGVEDVSFVRFDDFAKSRGESLVSEVAEGGGLFQPLTNALDEAAQYRRMGERMFYLAKRAPTLVTWQTQALADEVLAKEETKLALSNLNGMSKSVDALGKTVTKLADEIPQLIVSEREAVFAEIDRRQKDVDAALEQVKTISADATKATADVRAVMDGISPTLKSAEETLSVVQPTLNAVQVLADTSERILGKVAELKGPPDPNAPPSKPVDIAEYGALLNQATTTLIEANRLIENGESLAGSAAIKGVIEEVTTATEQRIASLEQTVARMLWLAGGITAALILLTFALLFASRTAHKPRAAS